MNSLLQHIKDTANTNPQVTALQTHQETFSYAELVKQTEQTISNLQDLSPKVIALIAENTPAWVIIDLACQELGICLLPLPTFFSEKQLNHALETSNADVLLMSPFLINAPFPASNLTKMFSRDDDLFVANQTMTVYSRPINENMCFPKETGKITFTSGSTGSPKGVCLSNGHILTVASSLNASLKLSQAKHLSLLPLSTLLENIAGIYTPLLSGGMIVLLPPDETGLLGSSKLDVTALLSTLTRYQPETLILIPELLRVLVAEIRQGWEPPKSLKYIAVGGAKVSPDLVRKARRAGLPVYEGYGLSECASVVCLNTPQNDLAGSVGKPLEHTGITLIDDEVIVNKPIFLGYLNEAESWYPNSFATGDLAYQDKNGFLHIKGRKKNVLISSFGRNINPEWLESELQGSFAQAIVFGDQQAFCVALLVPYDTSVSDELMQASIDAINQKLPDYGRIQKWLRPSEPFSIQNELLTETGKLKRTEIYQFYQKQITRLYKQGEH